MKGARALVDDPSLDVLIVTLSPDPLYLSVGGRSVLLAEAFDRRVTGFDTFAPYLAVGHQAAIERRVERLVTFRLVAEREPLTEIRHGSFDAVLGLGGTSSDSIHPEAAIMNVKARRRAE